MYLATQHFLMIIEKLEISFTSSLIWSYAKHKRIHNCNKCEEVEVIPTLTTTVIQPPNQTEQFDRLWQLMNLP